VRECEKGGTSASTKAVLDRAIDQWHRETKEKGDLVRDVVADAADKLRITIGTLPKGKEVEGAIEKNIRNANAKLLRDISPTKSGGRRKLVDERE